MGDGVMVTIEYVKTVPEKSKSTEHRESYAWHKGSQIDKWELPG
jgi:hypothetical protein